MPSALYWHQHSLLHSPERERESLLLSVAYINVGLEGWFQRPSDTKGRLPCVLSQVHPLSLLSFPLFVVVVRNRCHRFRIKCHLKHSNSHDHCSSQTKGGKTTNPTFARPMHWVLGFNAKKPNFCKSNHGFVPVVVMCILAGNYHQGWANSNFFGLMHWIFCFNAKKSK